jgi:hypothetical protein
MESSPETGSPHGVSKVGGDVDPLEGQAKAIIAAALIVRGAVEVPAIPTGTRRVPDTAGMRLRELTDYVYRLLTTDELHDSEWKHSE